MNTKSLLSIIALAVFLTLVECRLNFDSDDRFGNGLFRNIRGRMFPRGRMFGKRSDWTFAGGDESGMSDFGHRRFNRKLKMLGPIMIEEVVIIRRIPLFLVKLLKRRKGFKPEILEPGAGFPNQGPKDFGPQPEVPEPVGQGFEPRAAAAAAAGGNPKSQVEVEEKKFDPNSISGTTKETKDEGEEAKGQKKGEEKSEEEFKGEEDSENNDETEEKSKEGNDSDNDIDYQADEPKRS